MRRYLSLTFLALLTTFSFAAGIETPILQKRLDGASAQDFSLCIPVLGKTDVPNLDGVIDAEEWACATKVNVTYAKYVAQYSDEFNVSCIRH